MIESQRTELLERLRRAEGGPVDWYITAGISTPETARAWIGPGPDRRWGGGTIESDLFGEPLSSAPHRLGLRADCPIDLVDLGCGDDNKGADIAQQLAGWGAQDHRYIAVDDDQMLVERAVATARAMTPGLSSGCFVGDFTRGLRFSARSGALRLVVFLGNTVNTFEADEASRFLRNLLDPADVLVTGVRYLRTRVSQDARPVRARPVEGEDARPRSPRSCAASTSSTPFRSTRRLRPGSIVTSTSTMCGSTLPDPGSSASL